VTPATYSDEFAEAVHDVLEGLSELRGQCDILPSRLEKDIDKIWRMTLATKGSVRRLQGLCPRDVGKAIEVEFRKVYYAADALRDHVQGRKSQKADEYLKARGRLTGDLIDELDVVISFFSELMR
jgi:hypothetical protein